MLAAIIKTIFTRKQQTIINYQVIKQLCSWGQKSQQMLNIKDTKHDHTFI